MKTFETLKRYLSQNDWAGAIDYLIGEEKKCPKDLDVSLNLIYCFGIFLTEMDPSRNYGMITLSNQPVYLPEPTKHLSLIQSFCFMQGG